MEDSGDAIREGKGTVTEGLVVVVDSGFGTVSSFLLLKRPEVSLCCPKSFKFASMLMSLVPDA